MPNVLSHIELATHVAGERAFFRVRPDMPGQVLRLLEGLRANGTYSFVLEGLGAAAPHGGHWTT